MKPESPLRNQLKSIRTRLGYSQQDLATLAGVTRQTIGGIEGDLFAPSAIVALRLAKALGCRVEEIFWMEDALPILETKPAHTFPIKPLEARVALARVGHDWIAHPLIGASAFRQEMIPADGIGLWEGGESPLSIKLLTEQERLQRTVLLAGCTPALSLLARSAEQWHPGLRVLWLHANSTHALQYLALGEIHAAGVHLCDSATEEDNIASVRRSFPKQQVVLVHLGVWEEGLLFQYGNPKAIRELADLERAEVRLIAREEGAGSQYLLCSLLDKANLPREQILGRSRIANSHTEIAEALLRDEADTGISTASIASLYGLGFLPLRPVAYDLVLHKDALQEEPIQQLLGLLNHRHVLAQFQTLVGYDTQRTGEIREII